MPHSFFDRSDVKLYRKDGEAVDAANALDGITYVLVYFSAQWCAPCRHFTPRLKQFYDQHHLNENFAVIFVSLDNSAEEMMDYFKEAHGDYYRLSHNDAKVLTAEWSQRYNFQTIPTLLVFKNGSPRKLVVRRARRMLEKDPLAKFFPWTTYENPEFRAHM